MIRLSTFEKNKFETIKNISEEVFANLKHDSEILKNAHTQFVVFKYLQLNIKEYSNFINETSNIPVNKISDIRLLHHPNLLLNANRVTLNLLSSFKFFLDNAETYLKRKFGKESQKVEKFKQLTSDCYDNSFAYRFLSKLRNYAIHLGFPLKGLTFNADPDFEKPELMVGELQQLVDIKLIKKEKRLLGGIYKEVSKIENDIDIRPLVVDLSKSILKIQSLIHSTQEEEIDEAISNIETFAGKYKTDENDIKVFHNLRNGEEIIEFNAYHIPFEIISDFKKYKKSR